MSLALRGVLPLSAINVGLVAALPAFAAKVTQLEADLTKFGAALVAQGEVSLNPPDPLSLAAGLSAQALAINDLATPGNFVVGGADVQADLTLELGTVEAQLELVGAISAQLGVGASAGGVASWVYAGRANGFGQAMAAKARGWSGVESSTLVSGLVVMTESPSSWDVFRGMFHTGSSSDVATSDAALLRFLGVLSGGEINTGVLAVQDDVDTFLLKLRGMRVALLRQLDVSAGLNLPDLNVLASVLGSVSVSDLLSNAVNVRADLSGSISGLEAKIDGVLSAGAALELALSAGGFAVWSYQGTAGELGAELEEATSSGIPGGHGARAPAYGWALACGVPNAWTSLSAIVGVG